MNRFAGMYATVAWVLQFEIGAPMQQLHTSAQMAHTNMSDDRNHKFVSFANVDGVACVI
jgi:hypothetical protein